MTSPFKGKYSSSVKHSSKKRYYVLQAQRNTPLLDAEVRELSENTVELNRWLSRNSYGDLAVISPEFSDQPNEAGLHRVNGFQVGPVSSTGDSAFDGGLNNQDFRVFGGLNGNGYNDQPAMMYLKGWYIFLSTDILWSSQNDDPSQHLEDAIKEYPGEVIPDASSPTAEQMKYAIRSDTYVKDVGPLHSGYVGQNDVVYVELTLDEVTDGAGSPNPGVEGLQDPSIKDPVIGNDTANRVKASVKFLVYENWDKDALDPLSSDIFGHHFFAEGEYTTGVKYYRAPISVIVRSHSTVLSDGDFTDILALHDKRVYPPVELTHRLRHGGYIQNDVDAGRALASDLDEKWGATGRNEGVSTEAFNTDSVTPRVIDHQADYKLQSVAVAGSEGEQGLTGAAGTIQPDADGLEPGEVTAKKIYSTRLHVRETYDGDSPETIEEARTDLEESLIRQDGAGFTGTINDVHTHNLDTGVPNNMWTQEYHSEDPDKIVSVMDKEGKLALGKEVDYSEDYQLDVAERSNFDKHADFRGDTNQFHHDVGVTGTASIYDAQWDRQTNMFSAPKNNAGSDACWKMCEMELYSGTAGEVSFTLDVVTNSGSADDRVAKYKVRFNKSASNSVPELEVVALVNHKVTPINFRAYASSDSLMSLYVFDEQYGKEYSYRVTNYRSNDSRMDMFGSDTTSWVATPTGTWQDQQYYYVKSAADFSQLKADGLAYNSLGVKVDTQGTIHTYKIASKSDTPTRTESHQSYYVVVKDDDYESVPLDMAFKLSITHTGDTNFTITATNLSAPHGNNTNHRGLYRVYVNYTSTGSLYNIYFCIKDTDSSPSSTKRNVTIQVSEDIGEGLASSENPFILEGRPDEHTVLSTVVTTTTPTKDLILYDNYTTYDNSRRRPAALVTTDAVRIGKGASIDLTDQTASGAIGATTNAGRIRDMDGSLGLVNQYLSAETSGNKWKYPGSNLVDMGGSAGEGDQILVRTGSGSLWTDAPLKVFDTVAELRALNPAVPNVGLVYVKGFYSPGDGGGGLFRYDSTIPAYSADDGYYVCSHAITAFAGRFVRQLENKTISVACYGVIPGTLSGVGAHFNVELQAAVDSALAHELALTIPSSFSVTMDLNEDFTFPANLPLTIGEDVTFYKSVTASSTRPGLNFEGPTTVLSNRNLTHVETGPKLMFHPGSVTEVKSSWWFVAISRSDNTEEINDMYESLSEGMVVVFDGFAGSTGFLNVEGVTTITSPTKFIEGCGINLENFGAVITVSAEIIAGDYPVIVLPAIPQSVNTAGPLNWSIGSKLNVTWVGVLPDEQGGSTSANNLKVAQLLANFGYPREGCTTLWFPLGSFGLASTYTLTFPASVSVSVGPGAYLYWDEDADVKFEKFEDTPGPKFCFTKADAPENVSMPFIGGGTIRSEWFRDFSSIDAEVLTWAIGALKRTTKIDDSNSLTDVSDIDFTEGEGTTLYCGGHEYVLTDTSVLFPTDGTCRNLTIKDLSVSGTGYSSSYSDYWGSAPGLLVLGTDRATVRSSTHNLSFENCHFKSSGHPSVGAFGVVGNLKYTGCSFNNAHINADYNHSSYADITGLLVENCSFNNCTSDLTGASNTVVRGCSFTGYASSFDATLSLGEGSKVFSCDFSSSDTVYVKSAIRTYGRDITLIGNTLVNSDVRMSPANLTPGVEAGHSTTLKDIIVTGNRFTCLSDSAGAIFLQLYPGGSGTAMSNLAITGNSFICEAGLVLDTSVSGVTSYNAVLEAIDAVEVTGTGFDDTEIYDVIVKDNTGTYNVNVKATELTESVRLTTDPAVEAPTLQVNVPEEDVDTEKRLVGIPNCASFSVQGYRGWIGLGMSGAESRHGRFELYARYGPSYTPSIDPGDLSWGLPPSTTMTVTVSFKTYKNRMGATENLVHLED